MIADIQKKQKDPTQEEINFILSLLNSNKIEEVKKQLNKQIITHPESSVLYNILGAVFATENKLEDAIVNYEKSLKINPNYAQVYNNLGVAFQKLNKVKEAIENYKKAIHLKNDFAEAYNNLGNAINMLKNTKDSIYYYEKAIKIKSNYPEAFNNLATAYLNLGNKELALDNFKKALKVNENYVEVYNKLGSLFEEMSKFEDSLSNYNKAIELKPNFEKSYNNLGNLLSNLGKYEEAEIKFNQAIKIKPNYAKAYSNLLLNLNYKINFDHSFYLSVAKNFSINCRTSKKIDFKYQYDKNPKKLKIGFVSSDFGNHPGGYFTLSTLKELTKKNFDLICYSAFERNDTSSKDFKPLFSKWISIENKTDEEVVAQISKDQIHILIDLQGHSGKNRLPIFFYKPAPIQVSWLSQGTLGIKEIDYLVGSPHITPKNEEKHFLEKIWRLPEITQCFTVPNFDVVINSLPASKNNFITFGSMNKITKINDNVISLWSKVLLSVNNSKLLLRNKDLDNREVRKTICQKFNKQGVKEGCLIFYGETKTRKEILETYNKIDISLDPFPFQGNTSSCESIWMGVPVLTLKGNRFLFHFGESINCNIGMNDWVAKNEGDYISKAIKFSSDINRLVEIRKNLRKAVLKSPVFDSQNFSNHFANMLWEMWKKFKV